MIEEIDSEEKVRSRVLIIPEGFSDRVKTGEKTNLTIKRHPDSDPQYSQAAYSHVLKAIIKTITGLVGSVQLAEEKDESQGIEEIFLSYQPQRLITLRSELATPRKAIPSGYNHTIPAMTIMFILFTVLMYGGITLLEERRQGQLERIVINPISFSLLLAGKWLSRFLLGMFQLTVLFLAGYLLFGFNLGSSLFSVLLISLFFCRAIAGLSLLMGSLFEKEELLVVVSILLANLMAGLGGCWCKKGGHSPKGHPLPWSRFRKPD
ncbi:MAG: ABC transporter permease [Acidobacteriota bacterium]